MLVFRFIGYTIKGRQGRNLRPELKQRPWRNAVDKFAWLPFFSSPGPPAQGWLCLPGLGSPTSTGH